MTRKRELQIIVFFFSMHVDLHEFIDQLSTRRSIGLSAKTGMSPRASF